MEAAKTCVQFGTWLYGYDYELDWSHHIFVRISVGSNDVAFIYL